MLAVRSDGSKVQLARDIEYFRNGERLRFMPGGKSIVYMKGFGHSLDFWMLDLATGAERQLTRLGSVATMRTFDIADDGKSIIFDRIRQNSDVVLIDRGPAPTAK